MEQSTTLRAEVRAYIQEIISGSVRPYDAALEISARAGRECVSESPDMCFNEFLLIWSALTDRVELRPSETADAEADMIAAGREWLESEGDSDQERRYFDRWIHDKLGYSRSDTSGNP
ncbi:hypothetical protein ACIQU6_34990 [Streptomyces sp. NPDC090442]|uniref:hypothetical protein n=1 Tax=Streptomyces sp. NPDC090442 TaxID=3365962 RepID=UPI0038253F28